MKTTAIMLAALLGSAAAVAQSGAGAGAGPGDHPGATQHWEKNAKDGYMTREQAMAYKPSNGKPMNFSEADRDGDGRVSQSEWMNYHGMGSASGARSGHGSTDKTK